VACELDLLNGPFDDERKLPGRWERPEPELLLPTTAASSSTARCEHRFGWFSFFVVVELAGPLERIADVGRLTSVGELDAEPKKLRRYLSAPPEPLHRMAERVELKRIVREEVVLVIPGGRQSTGPAANRQAKLEAGREGGCADECNGDRVGPRKDEAHGHRRAELVARRAPPRPRRGLGNGSGTAATRSGRLEEGHPSESPTQRPSRTALELALAGGLGRSAAPR
jgi:hypothetical protein